MKFTTVKKQDLIFSNTFDLAVADDRKFRGEAYSGKPILNHPFWGNLSFEISSMSALPKVPVLFNHNPDRPVGHGSMEFSDKAYINGMISDHAPDGKWIYNMVKDEGFPMQESVFIEPDTIEQVKAGAKVTVNGHELTGPGHVFRGGKIREVSFTPLGADGNTTTTIFNQNEQVKVQIINSMEEPVMNEEMKKFTELFATSPDEAFKFACSCQEKSSEKASEGDQKKIEDLQAANEELKKEIADLKKAQKEKASAARGEKLKLVFKDLGVTLSPELEESYVEMAQEKFDKVIAGLEADAKTAVENRKKQFSALNGYQAPDAPVGTAAEKKAAEDKVFSVAREMRKVNPNMGVAASLDEARKKIAAETTAAA